MTTEQFNERFEQCIRQSIYGFSCPLTDNKRVIEDLGADALDIVELAMELEAEFDVTLPEEGLNACVTVGDYRRLVKDNLGDRISDESK